MPFVGIDELLPLGPRDPGHCECEPCALEYRRALAPSLGINNALHVDFDALERGVFGARQTFHHQCGAPGDACKEQLAGAWRITRPAVSRAIINDKMVIPGSPNMASRYTSADGFDLRPNVTLSHSDLTSWRVSPGL